MRISKVKAVAGSHRTSPHFWNGRPRTAFTPGEVQPAIARSVSPTAECGGK